MINKYYFILLFFWCQNIYSVDLMAYHIVGVDSNNDGHETNLLIGISPAEKHKTSVDYLSQVRVIGQSKLKDSLTSLNYYYSAENYYMNIVLGVNSTSVFLPELKTGINLYYNIYDYLELNVGYTLNDYSSNSVDLIRVGGAYSFLDRCTLGFNTYLSQQSESVYSFSIMNRCEWRIVGYRLDYGLGETFADIGIKDEFSEASLYVYLKSNRLKYGIKSRRYVSNFINETYIGLQLDYSFDWGKF